MPELGFTKDSTWAKLSLCQWLPVAEKASEICFCGNQDQIIDNWYRNILICEGPSHFDSIQYYNNAIRAVDFQHVAMM